MIKLCYKQTLSATDSRPPTYCPNANGSSLDVGVRLKGRGKSSSQLVALPLRKQIVSAINTKWEGDIQAVASCYWQSPSHLLS
jgi:hypothetical protein